jgi:hypothetical protein
MFPGNGLQYERAFVDHAIGSMTAELTKAGIANNTLVIISAKHGQSPIDLSSRVAVDASPYDATPGFSSKVTDDVALLWLTPQSQQTDYKAAKAYLMSQKSALGIGTLLDKSDLAPLYGNPFRNNRTPDFIARTIHGLIYTSGTKLAEHGGFRRRRSPCCASRCCRAFDPTRGQGGERQGDAISGIARAATGLPPRR